MNRRVVEILIGTGVILLISAGVFILVHFVGRSRSVGLSTEMEEYYRIEGEYPVPYFIVAVDRSASMNYPDSDPGNYEKEALKLIVRMLFFNQQELVSADQYPKLKILQFSGQASYLTPAEDWISVRSEADVDRLDAMIDQQLAKRDGMFTDFNAIIDQIRSTALGIPSHVGSGDQKRPTATIAIVLTDGTLDPNYLNRINHPNDDSWQKFKDTALATLTKTADKGFADKVAAALSQNGQADPIEIAREELDAQRINLVVKNYYSLARKYGDSDPANNRYARNEAQSRLRTLLKNDLSSPLQLNMLGLLTEAMHETDIQYLQDWTRGMGFFQNIRDAGSLGEVFLNTLSMQINAFTDSLSLRGETVIGPLAPDVTAATLTVNLPPGFPDAYKDRFVQLVSPGGRIVPSKLNGNLKYSMMFSVCAKDYPDFHSSPGWKIILTPVSTPKGIFDHATGYWTTLHDYYLDVRSIDGPESSDRTLYSVKLRSQKSKKYLLARDFDVPMKIGIIATTGEEGYPVSFVKTSGDSVVVDFSSWPAGKHTVKFSLEGGRIKGAKKPLSARYADAVIEIGNRVTLRSGNNVIGRIKFEPLDRKTR